MHRLVAWFRFAKRSWLALGLGWLSLLAALAPQVTLNQTGALLICAAIVAEVLHEKRHRLYVHQITPGYREHYQYREVVTESGQESIEITPHAFRTGKVTVPRQGWALYHLANPDEFSQEGPNRMWGLERTMARAERTVDIAIVISLVAGTLLSAFA